MYVHFRKRFGEDVLAEVNELIVKRALEQIKESGADDDQVPPATHKGKHLIGATCTPSDIAFPTDLGLLNKAKEKTETMIDTLHAPQIGKKPKPRTYRIKACKQYLAVAKKKSPGRKAIRKAIRQQLSYVRRNLKTIDKLADLAFKVIALLFGVFIFCRILPLKNFGNPIEQLLFSFADLNRMHVILCSNLIYGFYSPDRVKRIPGFKLNRMSSPLFIHNSCTFSFEELCAKIQL